MIIEDCEIRPGINLEGTDRFPDRITLGAIRDDSLMYRMGKAAGEQFKRAGVHVNLAPVTGADPDLQKYISIGENHDNAAYKSRMYINGLKENGIITVPKHFPISFKAGTYIPESAGDPQSTIKEISESIKKGLITRDNIDEQCRKILALKYWSGLSHFVPIETENLQYELSPPATKALIRELYSSALTVLINKVGYSSGEGFEGP